METLLPNGNRIRELRKEAGLTQEELAHKAWGLEGSVVNVYRAEKGFRRMRRSTLSETAQALSNALKREVKLEEIVLADPPTSVSSVSGPGSPKLSWANTVVLIPAFGPVPDGVFTNANVCRSDRRQRVRWECRVARR